jgi:hypothetical protein
MIKKTLQFIRKFYIYQKERFPLAVLALSLFPAILSSGAVMTTHPTLFQMSLALVASVAYLLHIRIIDEHRDFIHDNVHHATRPIQIGIISRKELRYIDFLAIFILVAISVIAKQSAVIIVIIMLGYSYLASKEFFIGEKIRQYFFGYNIVNLVQMLLMQVFVYTIFSNPFPLSKLTIFHFLFTSVGTIIFEFVRKLKIPGEDGSGKDTYTYYLGFDKSMIIYQILLIINASLFFLVATTISSDTLSILLTALGLLVAIVPSIMIHKMKKTQLTDQVMQLSFLILYGAFNLIIYFLKIN